MKMNIPRILSNTRNIFARSIVPHKKSCGEIVTRSYYQLTPPTVKVSVAERVILSLIITVSVCFIPVWVIYHIPEYQGERKPKE